MADEPVSMSGDEVLKEVPTPRTIRRIERFIDNMGRMIEVFTEFDPAAPFGMSVSIPDYVGQGFVTGIVNTPQGARRQEQPFRFKIEATNLAEAFDRFDESAQAEIKNMEEAQRKAMLAAGGRVMLPPNGHKH